MARIDLPASAWAELRDPDVVTERGRKPLIAALNGATKAVDDGVVIDSMLDVQDALIVVMVEAWSFDLPVEADSLLDLPAKTVTALRKACAKFQDELMPDFGPTPDPASPSVPSSD